MCTELKELGLIGKTKSSTLDSDGASMSDSTSQYTPYIWLLLAITISLFLGTICMIIISRRRRRRRKYSEKTLKRWKDYAKSANLDKDPFHINIDTSASVGSSNISSLELNSFESFKNHIANIPSSDLKNIGFANDKTLTDNENDLINEKDTVSLCKITVNKRNIGDDDKISKDIEVVEEKKTVPPGWCMMRHLKSFRMPLEIS